MASPSTFTSGASSNETDSSLLPKSQQKLDREGLPSLRRVGRGLSGFVYETALNGKRYARKDFPLGSARHVIFEKEVSTLLDLDHQNIVKYVGYALGRSSCSVVQEYMDDDLQSIMGRRIEAHRQRNPTSTSRSRFLAVDEVRSLLLKLKLLGSRITIPFDILEVRDIISQIVSGLRYLHDHQVAHGDLKPNNVLVHSESGKMKVKVTDFGLFETKKRIKLVSTRTQHYETLMWKAPELFEKLLGPLAEDSENPITDSDSEEDERVGSHDDDNFKFLAMADVYSFGLICSHILGGKLSFPDMSLTQLRKQRMHDCKPELPSACPENLRFIINRCLETEPTSRPNFSDLCTLMIGGRWMYTPKLTYLREGFGEMHHSGESEFRTALAPASASATSTEYFSICSESMSSGMGKIAPREGSRPKSMSSGMGKIGPCGGSRPKSMSSGMGKIGPRGWSRPKSMSSGMGKIGSRGWSRPKSMSSGKKKQWAVRGVLSQELEVASNVEEQIELSKRHWSELWDRTLDSADVVSDADVASDNLVVFEELQRHPSYGTFFKTFGYDTQIWKSAGTMEVGEKFAEGGQAELFHCKVTWEDPKFTKYHVSNGIELVVKVFKRGTLLREVQKQFQHGYLQWIAQDLERLMLGKSLRNRYTSQIFCGTLLKDGRVAFLMKKEHMDLRSLIDYRMWVLRDDYENGPFQEEDAEWHMYRIALGMDWLHKHNIVHRDLKASNVFVDEYEVGKYSCYVADFEYSIGVMGTGFFRPPEVLKAGKERAISTRKDLFTSQSDAYSYAMTCYEVLTGKLPFQDHPLKIGTRLLIDLVIEDDLRPELPSFVNVWTCDLLQRCWESNPLTRPLFGEILEIIEVNSKSKMIERWAIERKISKEE